MDRKKVEEEARKILEKFAKALEKVEKEKVDENNIEFCNVREKFEREEKESEKCDFKISLLENAPKKNKDFVLAEKGAWK